MPYIVKHCNICGKEYHVHKNGKVKGACKHIKIGRLKGRKTYVATVDTNELDALIKKEEVKKEK